MCLGRRFRRPHRSDLQFTWRPPTTPPSSPTTSGTAPSTRYQGHLTPIWRSHQPSVLLRSNGDTYIRQAGQRASYAPSQQRKETLGPKEDKELPPSAPPPLDLKSTLKLSELVNPMWYNKLIPLTEATTNLMHARYKSVFGMDPAEHIEPTTDQIAAIKMLDDLSFIPGVDFSFFGPHGRRAMKKLKYAAQMWDPETQTYKRRDLPGPPDFDTWLRSWKVFKCNCLILDMQGRATRRTQRPHKVPPPGARTKALVHHSSGGLQTQGGVIRTLAPQRGSQRRTLRNEPKAQMGLPIHGGSRPGIHHSQEFLGKGSQRQRNILLLVSQVFRPDHRRRYSLG
jgi:hypothetical protein